MGDAADPVAKFERVLRRRMRGFFAALVALLGAQAAALVWYVTVAFGEVPLWVLVDLLVVVPASVVAFVWTSRRGTQRLFNQARQLRPRVRDIATLSRMGILYVLDNGLLLSPAGAIVWVRLFGTPSGSPALPVTAREALALHKGMWRMKTIGSISSKRGPEWLRRELDEIRIGLGMKRAFAHYFERSVKAKPDPTAPAWMAVAAFNPPLRAHPMDRWPSEVDRLRGFLEGLRSADLRSGGA